MSERLLSVERRILTAYREFFNENYAPSQEQNTDIHVQAHKMCYLLSRINCDIVETGFVWNTFGPFSVRLQEILKQLDTKGDALQDFYQEYKPEDILDEDILEGIEKLKTGLKVSENKDNSRRWIELLASLSFLAHSELPTSGFSYIISELKERKPSYKSDTENRKAWELLESLGVAY